ncbi:MAG: hypothetical protein Q7J07_02995 [Pelolinea sp.]|nr:hypothetical protein [Pelolinea sp.]
MFQRFFYFFLSLTFLLLSFTSSSWNPIEFSDKIRQYTRQYEFDYTGWEISAVWEKISTASLGSVHYLNTSQQRKIIEDYFTLLITVNELQQNISEIYGDPNIPTPEKKAVDFEKELENVNSILTNQKQLTESILQYQIGQAIYSLGLSEIGTPFPPILFQTTKLPNQLIISPREAIFQEENISLIADVDLNEIVKLENAIEKDSDYSALVVSVGGVSTYPTMVINTTNLSYLIETIAHEWVHNYLALRPLGLRYSSSRELRTMNETVASIASVEISDAVIEMFYSNLVEIEAIEPKTLQASASASQPNQELFNFSKEMYQTRILVDELLSKEKIDEAERYMEMRRLTFWENGYHIRKINQAYFAFHGAYADEPFSAAGKDPVGDDVRFFRARQPSLASFIRKMSWMYSYPQLHTAARAY